MKFTISPAEFSGYRYVRAVAVIPKSKKLGIPRRYQRTWKVRSVAPEFTIKNEWFIFEREAQRWSDKVMAKIKEENNDTRTTENEVPQCQ